MESTLCSRAASRRHFRISLSVKRPSSAKQHKLGIGIATLTAILLIAAAGYGIYALLSRSKPAPFQNFTVSKATELGKATQIGDWHCHLDCHPADRGGGLWNLRFALAQQAGAISEFHCQ